MFKKKIMSCYDDEIGSSQGGSQYELISNRVGLLLHKVEYSIRIWAIGYYDYECSVTEEILLSATKKEDALFEFKEFLENLLGKKYQELLNCTKYN